MLLKTYLLALSIAGAYAQSSASSLAPSPTVSGSALPSSSLQPKPRWDWLSTTQKMHGMALGNWLILEKWMNFDWFEMASGNNDSAVDEWTLMEAIGDDARATRILTEHFNTWVTNDTIRNISESGFNTIRIPFGYWAFIDPIPGAPYVQAGQIDQINRVLEEAYKYDNLYVMLDVHGLPGSQNGEQPSGRQGLNGFYGDDNQRYGDQTIDAIIEFVNNSPYRDIISGVEVCNEPVYYNDEQFRTLFEFYERTYEKMSTQADPIPMIFHPGSPNSNPLDSSLPFIAGKNASLLIFEIHPYISRGASLSGTTVSEAESIAQLCSVTASYEDYPIPVAITEWSLINPIVGDQEWERRWFAAQAKAYAKSGGGIFWSNYVNSSTSYDQEESITFYQYSFEDLLQRGSIPLPSANQTTQQWLDSIEEPCPRAASVTQTWSQTIPTRTPASTSTGRANRKREVKRWV